MKVNPNLGFRYGDVRIKKARWWNRLGGKPVCHTASPRFISCRKQHYFIASKRNFGNLTPLRRPVK